VNYLVAERSMDIIPMLEAKLALADTQNTGAHLVEKL
jgi:hypothetical protein